MIRKYQSFQTTLFITKVEVENIVDEYQSALFSGQIQMNPSDEMCHLIT